MHDRVDETVAIRVEHVVVVLGIAEGRNPNLRLQILRHQVQRLQDVASVIALHLADAREVVVSRMVAVQSSAAEKDDNRADGNLLSLSALTHYESVHHSPSWAPWETMKAWASVWELQPSQP